MCVMVGVRSENHTELPILEHAVQSSDRTVNATEVGAHLDDLWRFDDTRLDDRRFFDDSRLVCWTRKKELDHDDKSKMLVDLYTSKVYPDSQVSVS